MIEMPINICLYSREQRDELQADAKYIKMNLRSILQCGETSSFLEEFLKLASENKLTYQLTFVYPAKDITELRTIKEQLKRVNEFLEKYFTEMSLQLVIDILNKIINSIEKYETEHQN